MKKEGGRRDHLAEQRTHLANERTLLAYWRTAFSFFILAAFISKFSDSDYSAISTSAFAIFSVVIFIYGFVRFRKYHREILAVK
ncbi:DUF202 domain-containing protein [archaeon]|jgi:putative membrane protein|nr:DUF202 domain-containing protein [archaeon]MBT6182948.1 DUF202 domain-containing protein [archaeon]MBT6606587.1 DUF202 domain-containing protein [archaeon]MBT7251786.1 DUF202 domain-containing protein [archaeon]MBT7660807.1 DUF202 domain-containing protein [archaeon]